jgi:hypothetical protein
MKPESYAWRDLNDHAATLLRPGFADRTLRAARALAPTVFSQCMLSAATAGVCLLVVFFVHTRQSQDELARNIEGWRQLAAETDRVGEIP